MSGKESHISKMSRILAQFKANRSHPETAFPIQPTVLKPEIPATESLTAEELSRLQDFMAGLILPALERTFAPLGLDVSHQEVRVMQTYPFQQSGQFATATFELDLGCRMPFRFAVNRGLSSSDIPYPQPLGDASMSVKDKTKIKALQVTILAALEMRQSSLEYAGWELASSNAGETVGLDSITHQAALLNPRALDDLDLFYHYSGLSREENAGQVTYFLPRVEQFTITVKKMQPGL